MDSGIQGWIIPLVGVICVILGWFSSQYWQHRTARRQATHDADDALKGKKTLLENLIAFSIHPTSANPIAVFQTDLNRYGLLRPRPTPSARSSHAFGRPD